MEALGGDQLWVDRFLAMHASIAYYWFLLLFYLISPKIAYNFAELVEYHAVDTYTEFVEVNEELLKSLPPPLVAVQYYRGDDLYMVRLSLHDMQLINPSGCADLASHSRTHKVYFLFPLTFPLI